MTVQSESEIDDHHFAVKGDPPMGAPCSRSTNSWVSLRRRCRLSGIIAARISPRTLTYSYRRPAAMEGALLVHSLGRAQSVFALGGPVHWATHGVSRRVLARLLRLRVGPGTFVQR